MNYDPAIHHRRSIRLKGYDYSQAGAYFVTICAQKRMHFFGNVVNGEIQLNDAGRMVCRWYAALESKFPEIECDAFVCMPNHIHFIICLLGSDPVGSDPAGVDPAGVDPIGADPVGADQCVRPIENSTGQTRRSARTYDAIQWFKTMSTNEYIRGVKERGWMPFPGRLWQRNYWEHIVRDEESLNRIRGYIRNNPAQWERKKQSSGPGDGAGERMV